jgi:hypothetical protein
VLALLALPVVVAVALTHRALQTVAPSTILVARVRATRPTLLRAAGLGALALALVALAHGLTMAIASGGAGWLNLLVVVLLWDAIKFAGVAVAIAVRAAIHWVPGPRVGSSGSVGAA